MAAGFNNEISVPVSNVTASPSRHQHVAARIMRALQQHGALVVLLAVCLFGATRYSVFLTPENILNVLRQNSMLALVALGMTTVILTGGIDLSVGSLVALSGIVAASMSARGTAVAIVAGVATAAVLGAVNGLMITKVRIQPFIVTLAMMIAVRGVALGGTGENSVPLSMDAQGLDWLAAGRIGPIPVPVVIFVLVYCLGAFVLRYATFGRYIFAVGDDEEAARLLGLRTDRILIGVYTLSGALAGLAGVLLAARLGAGQPVAATGWELDAIAAVVVGGTVLTGGQGGVGRTLIGVVLLGVILNLLNLEGTLSPWWQGVVRGVFLLMVVLMQGRISKHESHA